MRTDRQNFTPLMDRIVFRKVLSKVTLVGIITFSILLAGCDGTPLPTSNANRTLTAIPSLTPTPELLSSATPAPNNGINEATNLSPTPILGEYFMTKVPDPTATPDALVQGIVNYMERAGLSEARYFGLSLADWANLAISIIFVGAGYFLGTWVFIPLLSKFIKTKFNTYEDQTLQIVSDLRWAFALLILDFATNRLTFPAVGIKTILADIYFTVGVLLVLRISFRIIDIIRSRMKVKHVQQGRGKVLSPLVILFDRGSRIFAGLVAFTAILSNFGINVNAILAALGIGGLAISLAAKDTISDAIAGIIILLDQPFRIGDRIGTEGIDSWGDVSDIGLRTTRIRTRDNRMIIVPNSVISANQVINYSYPDPNFRIETKVEVSRVRGLEEMRRLIHDAVMQVTGVLPDKPVDVLYSDMSQAVYVFRIRCWIQSYEDTWHIIDLVHTAVQAAFDKEGFAPPRSLNIVRLSVDQEVADLLSKAIDSSSDSNNGIEIDNHNQDA